MIGERSAFSTGFIVGMLITGCFLFWLFGSDVSNIHNKIKKEKQFILNKATYKCTKTNELQEGK